MAFGGILMERDGPVVRTHRGLLVRGRRTQVRLLRVAVPLRGTVVRLACAFHRVCGMPLRKCRRLRGSWDSPRQFALPPTQLVGPRAGQFTTGGRVGRGVVTHECIPVDSNPSD